MAIPKGILAWARIPALGPGVGGVSMSAGFFVVNVLFIPGIGANCFFLKSKSAGIGTVVSSEGKDVGAVRLSDRKCYHNFVEPTPRDQRECDYIFDNIDIGGGILAPTSFEDSVGRRPTPGGRDQTINVRSSCLLLTSRCSLLQIQ